MTDEEREKEIEGLFKDKRRWNREYDSLGVKILYSQYKKIFVVFIEKEEELNNAEEFIKGIEEGIEYAELLTATLYEIIEGSEKTLDEWWEVKLIVEEIAG